MTENSQTGTWVTAACRGDGLALAKLLAAHHPRLRARAEARLDPALKARGGPDDLLQELYLRVFRQIGQYEDRGEASFLNWLYTILDHLLIDSRRAAHRRVRDVDRESPGQVATSSGSYWDLLDRIQTDSPTPSRVVRREEALGALLSCVADLSEAHHEVIRLRFLEGLSVAEVAARLGKSEAAVVALTKRALDALRAALARRGEFSRGM